MSVRGQNSLFFSTGLQNDGLKQGANEAVGIVGNLASSISKINPFAILATGAIAAFSAIASSSYKMMKEFEQNMKEVETISAATQANFKGISSEVFALSKISPDAPAKLAQAYYQIVSAGYDGAEGLKLLETASKAATAGVTDTMTAADGITTVLNAFKLEASQADEVADAMFQTVKLGKTTMEELSSSLSQVAPLAAASGYSFQEVLAATASLTKQGTPTAQAMTQIRSALEATNEVLGDGAAKSMTLQSALQAMYDKAGGSQNKLKEMTGRMEAMNAILALAGPNAQGAAADLEALGNSAGSAEEAFKRMASSNTNEWKILGNRISATTESIGNSLVQMSSGIARFMNDALEDGEDLVKQTREQANEYNILKTTLEDANTPFGERIDILRKLKEQYPQYLESLDLDKVKNDNLEETLVKVGDALKNINDEQDRRLKLSGINQVQYDQQEQLEAYEEARERAKINFFATIEDIKDYAADNDIELNFSYGDNIDKIYNDIYASMDGKGKFLVGELLQSKKAASEYSKNIADSNRELDKTNEKLEAAKRAIYDSKDGYKEIISEVENLKSLADIEPYKLYEYPEIKEAVKLKEGILGVFEQIDLVDNMDSLEPYLNNAIKEIADYAKKKERLLNTDAPETNPESGANDKAFDDLLKEKEQQYKEYYATVEQLGKETADELFKHTIKQGETHQDYLQNLLDNTESTAKKIAIALSAQSNGMNLNRKDVSPVNEMTPKGVMEFEIDETSVEYIRRQIQLITEEWEKANEADRPEIAERLSVWEERLEATRRGVEQEKSIYDTIPLHINDLNRKELREYLQYWREKLKIAEQNSNKIAAEEAEAKVAAATKEIGDRTGDTMREISSSLGEASDMFRKFGDEDLADALDKMQSLGNNIATIVAGVTAGGPLGWLQAAGGIMGGLGSLFSGGSTDEISAYERSINNLEKSISKLTREMDKLYGIEKIDKRGTIIEDLEEEERVIKKEIEELKLWAQQLSPLTDWALLDDIDVWLEEENEKLDEVEDKLWAAREDQRNALTGTTVSSIADSIIEGFRQGKRGAEDFAATFEDLMKEAMLNSFKNEYLMGLLTGEGGFFDAFSKASEDGLTAEEIAGLQSDFRDIINGAEGAFEGMEAIFGDMGWDNFGAPEQKQQGLSGAIKGVTEDTANMLGGYMNAMRLDLRQSLTVNEQSMNYLSLISTHTAYLPAMSSALNSLDGRMATIESGIQDWQAQG